MSEPLKNMNMQTNIQRINAMYDAFAQGNVAGVIANVGENIDWTHPGAPGITRAGTNSGRFSRK